MTRTSAAQPTPVTRVWTLPIRQRQIATRKVDDLDRQDIADALTVSGLPPAGARVVLAVAGAPLIQHRFPNRVAPAGIDIDAIDCLADALLDVSTIEVQGSGAWADSLERVLPIALESARTRRDAPALAPRPEHALLQGDRRNQIQQDQERWQRSLTQARAELDGGAA